MQLMSSKPVQPAAPVPPAASASRCFLRCLTGLSFLSAPRRLFPLPLPCSSATLLTESNAPPSPCSFKSPGKIRSQGSPACCIASGFRLSVLSVVCFINLSNENSMRLAVCLPAMMLASLATGSHAQALTPDMDPANPALGRTPAAYQSAFDGYRHAVEEKTPPDQLWRAANEALLRPTADAGQDRETSRPPAVVTPPAGGHDMHQHNGK